jgi:hypothetical protein
MSERACERCGGELPNVHGNRRYCSDHCRRRAWDARQPNSCPECGGERDIRARVCARCQRATWTKKRVERYDKLAALWAEGLTIKQLAVEFGKSENVMGGMICHARKAGWDLPLRRPHRPKSGNLTKSESRRQFTDALKQGRIRRPTRCEECGEKGYVEGHHPDYQRPLYVEWLCSTCHHEIHSEERRVYPKLELAA